MRRRFSALLVTLSLFVPLLVPLSAQATPIGDPAFQRTWARTDQPVAMDKVARTWMWGPEAFTEVRQEQYAEAPGEQRTVQYFDKSRMELSSSVSDPANPWQVTNGLLVVELVTGRMQTGDARFEPRGAAVINAAGDPDDPTGITYATLSAVLGRAAAADGAPLIQRLSQDGQVHDDATLATYGVTAAHRVTVPGIDHQVASPFWTFLNEQGLVYENGQYTTDQLFVPWFYATGYPISEAYWARIKVLNTYKDVLIQAFERRVLTWTPDNPPGWRVEAGNVGRHYYQWRYEAQPGTQYTYVTGWGGYPQNDAWLATPRNLLATRGGEVYVANTGRDRIDHFAGNGVWLGAWGERGSNYGQFISPGGLAEDLDGNILVADTGNGRIQRFGPDGGFLNAWTATGLIAPNDLAVDDDGNIYAVDVEGDSVWKFNPAGQGLLSWNGASTPAGRLNEPHGLGLDAAGNVYVADSGNRRVVKFDAAGAFLAAFGADAPDALARPADVAVDAAGNVCIIDMQTSAMLIYGAGGALQGVWQYSDSPFPPWQPQGITIGPDGRVWIADTGNGPVLSYSPTGALLDRWVDGSRGYLISPTALDIDRDGRALVADASLQGIQVFGADGRFLRAWGLASVYADVKVAPDGDVWVVDSYLAVIHRYHPEDESYTRMTETLVVGANGEFEYSVPLSIAFDAEGNLYAADTYHHRIQKFSSDGQFVTAWGSYGTRDGEFQYPTGVTVSGDSVFVVEGGSQRRVQQFDLDGRLIRAWRSFGSGSPDWFDTFSITAADGFVYVSDPTQSRILKYTSSGALYATWGNWDFPPGGLSVPRGIALDSEGNVYVADAGAALIQIFAPVR